MKIAYISSAKVPSKTANSINVMKMCQAFGKNGNQVKLYLPLYNKNTVAKEEIYSYYEVDKCFDIEWIPIGKHMFAGHLYGLKALLSSKKWKSDLIYARSLLIILSIANFFTSTIYELHQPFSNNFFHVILRWITNKKKNQLVVISQALKNYCIENYEIKEEAITVAHDGADRSQVQNEAILKKSGANNLKVGYIGHLYPGKGMEIISELVKNCKWVDFHIIGGMEEDIKHWKNFLKGEKNIFFYGHLPHSETKKYRAACDVLIAPYQRQVSVYGNRDADVGKWMSPLKIFEYMASDKAILTSNLPVLKEVLENERNALLCDPENLKEWEENLKRLANDEDLIKNLSKNAKKDFLNYYTWEARAQNILKDKANKF